jgi:SAM-dependent methyltransferase
VGSAWWAGAGGAGVVGPAGLAPGWLPNEDREPNGAATTFVTPRPRPATTGRRHNAAPGREGVQAGDLPRASTERPPSPFAISQKRRGIAPRAGNFATMSDMPGQAGPRRAADRRIEDFDESYLGTPAWDIGHPQPVFLALLEEGAIRGRVLDAGCGTGEHTLMVAAAGHEALGVDAAPRAIEIATGKAADRGVAARFLVWDAMALADLGEQFDTVLDSGLFHVFDDDRRARYVASLAAVVSPGGRVLLACFSDRQPGDWGPRRVRQAELREAFAAGWVIESIEPVRFHTNLDPPTAAAWLARITAAPS